MQLIIAYNLNKNKEGVGSLKKKQIHLISYSVHLHNHVRPGKINNNKKDINGPKVSFTL